MKRKIFVEIGDYLLVSLESENIERVKYLRSLHFCNVCLGENLAVAEVREIEEKKIWYSLAVSFSASGIFRGTAIYISWCLLEKGISLLFILVTRQSAKCQFFKFADKSGWNSKREIESSSETFWSKFSRRWSFSNHPWVPSECCFCPV